MTLTAGILLHKRFYLGGIVGLFPAFHMIYNGTKYIGSGINIDILAGVLVLLFYVILYFYLWKSKNDDIEKVNNREIAILFI